MDRFACRRKLSCSPKQRPPGLDYRCSYQLRASFFFGDSDLPSGYEKTMPHVSDLLF